MIILTDDLLDEIEWIFREKYIGKKHIEEFFNFRFSDVKYHYSKNRVEVFIEDVFFYDEFEQDYLEPLVDDIIRYNFNVGVEGEESSYIIERLLEASINIYEQSEMI